MARTKFSEAVAHAQQLVELGCDRDEALSNTQSAFDLNDLELDLVDSNLDLVIFGELYE